MERKEAIYTRQSVSKSDNISIDTQIETCRRYSPDGTVYTDKGFSGKNTERPQLQQLIDEIQNDRISKVIVYRLDRISRNIVDFYNLYETMKRHNCSFQSATETFDTSTTMGEAMMGILAVFAQMERKNIQQRVTDAYYNKISDGRWCGGIAPFGFDLGKINGTSTLVPNQDLEAIKDIFHSYAYKPTVSLNKLATELRNAGYSKKIVGSTLSRLLRNPIYAKADKTLYDYYKTMGVNFINKQNEWNGQTSAIVIGKNKNSISETKLTDSSEWTIYLSNFKGIVSSEIFIMVQNRLAKNERIGRSNDSKSKQKELSGLIKCGHCGYAVKMKTATTLCCHGRDMKMCNVSFRGVRLENIQQQIDSEMTNKLNDLKVLYQAQAERRIKLLNEIEVYESEIKNLIKVIATTPELSQRLTEAIKERQNQIRLKELEYRTNDTYEILQYRMGSFTKDIEHIDYRSAPTDYKHMLCKIFIKRILLYPGGSIRIEWNDL